ncbi:DUF2550 family protein [Georgenia sunbinii]|uniref:DUF2550 family protein n=1 Tax=Georgenia sunbinii TaxID=3117728 RepID=UPI002F26B3B3
MGWAWLWWSLVLLAVLAVAAAAVLLRVRALDRLVGSFACAVREPESQHWTNGVAVYGVGRLDWYRLVSLTLRPRYRWSRLTFVVEPQRRTLPGGPHGVVEVSCRSGDQEFNLALAGAALDGLTSWLESSPPVDPGLR